MRWIGGDLTARWVQCVARIPWLAHVPRRTMIPVERLLIGLRGAGLFDPDFYRLQNADVAASGQDPFRHYLRHGWREGRAPNARFDDGHYRAESGLRRSVPVSALAHFVAFGQTGGLCPVPGIDLGALTQTHPALAVARLDPYRRLVTGDVEASDEGRPDVGTVLAALVDAPETWAGDAAEVDIVMPVYCGRAETLNAIWHVMRARNETRARLVAVNDASPDAPLCADLRWLADCGHLTLIEQAQNQGFAAAINLGSGLSPDRDLVWLNADTEVYDGWLDRLRNAAYAHPRAATVTPLTNNGTICSYPRINADNPGRIEIGWDHLDRLAAMANRGLRVETPTAVGFATYVRRDALEAVGPLDAASFGRGYGEENDFSRRAIARGWVNLIAADVVVRHFGATSFQGTRARRIERALELLDIRYPDYRASVQDFLARDPGSEARRTLDLARIKLLRKQDNILLITHSLGGGTEQHVQEEAARLGARGISAFLLSGGSGGPRTARLTHAEAAALPTLDSLPLEGDALWQIIAALGIDRVQIHHLVDFAPDAPGILRRRLKAAGIPYEFVVHDYFAACPRTNMVDARGHYCGEPNEASCQRCITQRGSRAGRPNIATWRQGYAALLGGAAEVRVPDPDVSRRLKRYFPTLGQIVVRPHEGPVVPLPRPPRRRAGLLRIATIGAIGATKGFDVLLDLAGLIQRDRIAATLTVIGHTQNDRAAEAAGITVTGAYMNGDADALIAEADPDLIFFASLWPETYSYTLSIALRSGRPVAAFDIGAFSTRLAGVDRAVLIPLSRAREPSELYKTLRHVALRGQQHPGETV